MEVESELKKSVLEIFSNYLEILESFSHSNKTTEMEKLLIIKVKITLFSFERKFSLGNGSPMKFIDGVIRLKFKTFAVTVAISISIHFNLNDFNMKFQ